MSASLDRSDERLTVDSSPRALLDGFLRRIRSGDLGMMPVIIGLIIIWIVFYTQNSRFLSSRNLVELSLDSATIGMISIGVVLVLLLGEIDLSIGSVSGASGAILAVLLVYQGWPLPAAILAAVATGLAIGVLYGLLYTRFGVPSFVITLAGLLALPRSPAVGAGQQRHHQPAGELVARRLRQLQVPAARRLVRAGRAGRRPVLRGASGHDPSP